MVAQENYLQIISEEKFEVNKPIEFSIKFSEQKKNSVVTITYPKKFLPDKDKFIQDNKKNVRNVSTDSENQKLSFELKKENELLILITGKFQSEGTQKFAIEVNDKIEQITFDIQSANKTVIASPLNDQLITRSNTRATLPNFDWELLNKDGLDLSTYKQVSVNTPVKITGGVFDNQQRDYYMFLGHVGAGNTYNYTTGFNTFANIYAPLGGSEELPLLTPVMIGVKKKTKGSVQSVSVFSYDYNTKASGTSVGSSGANLDIGEIDVPDGPITRSGVSDDNLKKTQTWIISQYVKDNELISYGFFAKKAVSGTDTNIYYQPVRVYGHIENASTGRIRFDVSFYNYTEQEKDFAITYGAHMDVGGAHESSRLFSSGKAGIAFNEPNATPVDGIPARINFYTNTGYENTVGPSDYKAGDLDGTNQKGMLKVGYWNVIDKQLWTNAITGFKNPYEAWDPIKPTGYEFPLTHPVFALRWNKIHLLPGEIGNASLDLSIEEPAPVLPFAEKTFTNQTSADGENYVGDSLNFKLLARNRGETDDWKQVELTDTFPEELEIDVNSLTMVDTSGKETALDPSVYDKTTHKFIVGRFDIPVQKQIEIHYKAKIISGETKTVINNFLATNATGQKVNAKVEIPIQERFKFNLKQEVLLEDGKSADEVVKGESLTYKTTILNPNSISNPAYKTFKVVIPIDSNLNNIRDVNVKNQLGETVGIGVYDVVTRKVTFSNLEEINTPINQEIFLEYTANVLEESVVGTMIKAKAEFTGKMFNEIEIDKVVSNEVETRIKGELLFVSAPKVLDFGQGLKIVTKNQLYPVISKDDGLSVQDNRGVGEHWSMSAVLVKELTSESGHKLIESLRYRKQDQEYIFTLGDSIPIVEKETENDAVVDVSADWSGTQNGPYLDIKAGTPQPEKYSGAVQWTLQNVPANE